MSEENVEIVRQAFGHFRRTGDFPEEILDPHYVWDMSTFSGWPEQKTYEGIEGAREFLRAWLDAWDEWELDLEGLYDAGDKVVALVRQHGRSKHTGLEVEMTFAQVFTMEGGRMIRMEMYADPKEALEAAGLRG